MTERSPAELIAEHQRRIDEVNAEDGEPRSALEYCQDVYRGRRQADPWRMRAAMAALPFESPKLTATAVSSMDGEHFAALLERAIARSQAPPKQIELKANAAPPTWVGPLVERAMNEREGLTIISQCSAGLTLVSDRVRSFEWISLPRREPRRARERLAPLRSSGIRAKDGVHIPAQAEVPDGKDS